jgi:hypothetical protein
MRDPYLICQLKHARRVFARGGERPLAQKTDRVLGEQFDSITPDETEARSLVHLALGGTIYA